MAALLKYKIFLIFAGLMVLEGVALMFVLGGSSNSTSEAEKAMVEDAKAQSSFTELELGDYKVSNHSLEGSPLRIDCKIFAEVPTEYEPKFKEAYDSKKHRVRDAIQSVIRAASYGDITDPDLGAVKRKLKKAITDVVGSDKPYVSQVIVSDFQSYEL
jgi:flagellar basal body-associated protein FliL